MTNSKFCPIKMMHPNWCNWDCEQEKCAWWSELIKGCSITSFPELAWNTCKKQDGYYRSENI